MSFLPTSAIFHRRWLIERPNGCHVLPEFFREGNLGLGSSLNHRWRQLGILIRGNDREHSCQLYPSNHLFEVFFKESCKQTGPNWFVTDLQEQVRVSAFLCSRLIIKSSWATTICQTANLCPDIWNEVHVLWNWN